MCYKLEKHKAITIKLSEEMQNLPNFISDFFSRYKSATSKKNYWCYLKDLLEWLIENNCINKQSLSEITPEDLNSVTDTQIIRYLDDLQLGITRKKNSLDSISTKKNIFSAFWEYLTVRTLVQHNVVKLIEKGRYKPEKSNEEAVVKIPAEEQLQSFLKALKSSGKEYDDIRNLTIVQLILGSGIRSEELINLDVGDVCLDYKHPYIMVLGKGKIEKYDKVPINHTALINLKMYLQKREEFLKEKGFEDNALFLSNQKTRISKPTITKFFEKYSNGEIYPHMLRHYVGTKLYEKTNNIVTVQKQLRHANYETTVKYYVHVDNGDLWDAIDSLYK